MGTDSTIYTKIIDNCHTAHTTHTHTHQRIHTITTMACACTEVNNASGTCSCAQKCTCGSTCECASCPNSLPNQAKAQGKTFCGCKGNEGVCSCKPGECGCQQGC